MSREPVDVAVPADKSMTHRALILGALADGTSRLRNLLDAADTRATAHALRRLGLHIPVGPLGDLRLPGQGTGGLRAPAGPLDCGNSGTTARLLLGALAGCPFEAVLVGDASLGARPMRRVTEPLARAGAAFDAAVRGGVASKGGDRGFDDGDRRPNEGDRLPLRVRGARPLRSIDWTSPVASAQVKSALLLAGLTGRAPVRLREPTPSRDHTERMLRAMGAAVDAATEGEGEGHRVAMEPPDRLDPLEFEVPGDISAAAFFLALGALLGPVRVRGVGLNPGRTGVLRVLARMGAELEVVEEGEVAGEPVGQVRVAPAPLRATTVAAAEVPTLLDEVPVLAVLAARAEGETRFDGLAELRVKESDRVAALSENLRRLGVQTEAGPDHLVVVGAEGPLGGVVDAGGDHRIAMAFGVLHGLEQGRVEVRGGDAVAVSFPAFWERLDHVIKELRKR